MSDRRRTAESNVGAFYGGVVQVSLPTPAVGVESQPSEPRPEDEWRVPMGPLETEEDVPLGPVHSNGTVVLPLQPPTSGSRSATPRLGGPSRWTCVYSPVE
ncbi:MAG: hypothetical protein ABSA21_01395 [Candidatus Limnocylindrales bacterium]|jgi:hypothetical protein